MKPFLTALLQCSVSMSVITLLYVAVSPLLSKRYTPRWRYTVWLVVAAGWLIPFRPLIVLPFLPQQSTSMPLVPLPNLAVSSATKNSVIAVAPSGMRALSIWQLVFLIWLAGVAGMLVYHMVRHCYFMKMVRRWGESETTTEILQLLDELKQEQNIKTKIEYKTCPSIFSPMMVGFFHPIVLMPPLQLSKSELSLILRHELTHFRWHDLWCKTIVLAATILHWFNPVVYLMAKAISTQCEISCDASVLKNEDMSTRKEYGKTIIAVVRGGNGQQTALSTNFYGGKHGMKKRIVAMLDGRRKKAGVTLLCIVLIGILFAGATLVAQGSRATDIPGTVFTKEEYAKLLALRFDDYEKMTVSEFRQKAWTIMDTQAYMKLLQRFYQNDQLDGMKDTNGIASFLFYELTPLTAEHWQTQSFTGSTTTNWEVANQAQLEYACTLAVLDPNRLTVGDYNNARKEVTGGLVRFFQSQSEKELQDEVQIKKALNAEIEALVSRWGSDVLTVRVDYFFVPLTPQENSNTQSANSSIFAERREYPNATKEDYRALLTLKTNTYQSETLAQFNAAMLNWANENYDRLQRILLDVGTGDFNVSLTPEERSFVTLTVYYSNSENAAMIQSEYRREPQKEIGFSASLPTRELGQQGQAWCSLFYQGSYNIKDYSSITVAERDRCIGGVLFEVQTYWNETDMEELLAQDKEKILAKLNEIAAKYSSDKMTISILPEQLSFDAMDEREIQD
jgi:beta-lactamase regulating signal transducer with metallopeptidase domain